MATNIMITRMNDRHATRTAMLMPGMIMDITAMIMRAAIMRISPIPKQLEGAWSWRKALPIAFAVGVRPCTGAILVLVFAIGQGLLWAGVFATFAMALGTAITVSALAALAVGSRELAVRIGNGGGGERVRLVAGIGGSALVMLMGVALFIGSLNGPDSVLNAMSVPRADSH